MAVSRRYADEREQRRGLIVGLTLAEVLLLLLFLMLLAFAAQFQRLRVEADQAQLRFDLLSRDLSDLKPLQSALFANGAADISGVEALVERFRLLTETEREVARLRIDNALLVKRTASIEALGADADSKLRALSQTLQRAAEIDPSDPPALLKRAVEVIGRLGASTQPDQVQPLSKMTSSSELSQKLNAVEATAEKYRRERDNLMNSGKGLSYPSCWIDNAGRTEFLFDVVFMDSGVKVNDATPGRAQDQAWTMVQNFARGSEISERAFLSATSKLASWSRDQKCRFYTRNHDATGATNKTRYKYLQGQIEQNFYPFYISRSSLTKGAVPTTVPTDIVPPTAMEQKGEQISNPFFGLFR
ncbi:hypothetical protein AB8A28_09225 [Tardiphaga sp. 71_E8_N1_1]|uniref:hypothetical protein n=1 Tax=Tardiphaga sp. 71_E8_N1_1 TaxID=3240784 RepID=UPI003F8C7192